VLANLTKANTRANSNIRQKRIAIMKIAVYIGEINMDPPYVVVHCRCINGPIQLGDVFTTLYSVTLHEPPTPTEQLTLSEEEITDTLALEVQEIIVYGTSLEIVDEGLTVSFRLSGSGIENLKTGSYLRGKASDHAVQPLAPWQCSAVQLNGWPLDVNGNPLPSKFSPDAHIPLPDFKFKLDAFK